MSGMNRQEAEEALRAWAARRDELAADRDPLVASALAAGVRKNRVHVLTGIARTTIDDILAGGTMKCGGCNQPISRINGTWQHAGSQECYPWRRTRQGIAHPPSGAEPDAQAAIEREEAAYFGESGHLVYDSGRNWKPIRLATRDELQQAMMLLAKAADYVAAAGAFPQDPAVYDDDYIDYERAVRPGCWPDEDGRIVTVDRPWSTYAEHDPGYDGDLRDLWPALWAEVTSSGRIVRRGRNWYMPGTLKPSGGE